MAKKEAKCLSRAQALQVVEVYFEGRESQPEKPWDELRSSLQLAWRQASQAATWMAVEFCKLDNKPLAPGKKPLPKISVSNAAVNALRLLARKQWPEIDSQTFYAISNRVKKRCCGHRFRWERRVLCKDSVPRFTYPQPLPVPKTCYKLEAADAGDSFWFRFRLLTGVPVWLRLGGGKEFSRQLAALRHAVRLEAENVASRAADPEFKADTGIGEASVYRTKGGKIMVSVCTKLPLPEQKEGRTMNLHTNQDALLVGVLEGRPDWVLNADNLRRQTEAHRVYLQRFRQDNKYEKRWPRQARRQMRRSMQKRCVKNDNRRSDFLHKAVASVVGYASRAGVATVLYDDRCRDFLQSFCWFQLATMLGNKCQEAGISFVHVNGETDEFSTTDEE